MVLAKKYATGLMNVIFILDEEGTKILLDNLYDGMVLTDSATGATVELEIATLDIDSLVLLGDDESDDLTLA